MTAAPDAAGAVTAATAVAALEQHRRLHADRLALWFRAGGRWAPITWGQLGAAAGRLAAVILGAGVAPGEGVALWLGNRPEWPVAELAALSAGATVLPLPAALTAVDAAAALEAAGSAVVVCASPSAFAAAAAARPLPRVRLVVAVAGGVEPPAGDDRVVSWGEALRRGDDAGAAAAAAVAARTAGVAPGSPATEVAATGARAAHTASHADVVAAARAAAGALALRDGDRVLSACDPALPAGRLVGVHVPLVTGAGVHVVRVDGAGAGGADDGITAAALTAACPTVVIADARRAAAIAGSGGAVTRLLPRRARRRRGLLGVRILVPAEPLPDRVRAALAALGVSVVALDDALQASTASS